MKRVMTLEYEDRALTKKEYDEIIMRLYGQPLKLSYLTDKDLEVILSVLADSRALVGHIGAMRVEPR